MNFLSTTNDDWNVDDADVVYDYDDDDGDDFGLPSLSNMKRRTKRIQDAQSKANATPKAPEIDNHRSTSFHNRRYSNSADIAIERPAPSYPLPKKSEGKILRPQYKDILKDPANALHLINHPSIPANASSKEIDAVNSRITRINKFKKILQASSVPLVDLRAAAWSGVPEEVRAMTWQLLLSYLPTSSERRVATLERKRKEYLDGVKQAFDKGTGSTGSGAPVAGKGASRGLDEAIWHQISIDVPRTNPHIELYGYEATQRSLERILYVWAVRHPASGYVQGINDLVTPFWQTFLGVYITDPDIESGMDPGQLPKTVLDAVEADSFWCLTKLLDGIQDHYIVAQPGIQRQVRALQDLTARIDATLARHLENEHVEFIQFSFRWMNCLLMREISVKNTIRMWDTYMVRQVQRCLFFNVSNPALADTSTPPPPLGRRKWLLRVSSLRLRRLPRQMVRQTCQDGLSGGHDVPAVVAYPRVDREGYRAAAQRSIHLAESIQGLGGASAGRAIEQQERVPESPIIEEGLGLGGTGTSIVKEWKRVRKRPGKRGWSMYTIATSRQDRTTRSISPRRVKRAYCIRLGDHARGSGHQPASMCKDSFKASKSVIVPVTG